VQSDCRAYLRKKCRRSNDQSLERRGRHWRLNLEHGCLLSFKETAREVLDPAGVADDAKAHMTSSER
jgi:hypothetical protein